MNPSGKNRHPNFLYAIFSVAAVLFFIGFLGMLLLQLQQFSKVIKEQVDLIVELSTDNSPEERKSLEDVLNGSAFIKANSLDFTSKEAALDIMSAELGEDLISLDLPNPLFDVYTFNVQATYLHPDSLVIIKSVLGQIPGVSDVFYQENITEQIARNTSKLGWLLLILSVLFSLIAIAVIHNTIRLSLYANRFLIKTQELVGATWEFISQPYLKKALWHGLISAILAFVSIFLVQTWLQWQVPELKAINNPAILGAVFISLVLLGMLINWLSTFRVLRKYLKLRTTDLY